MDMESAIKQLDNEESIQEPHKMVKDQNFKPNIIPSKDLDSESEEEENKNLSTRERDSKTPWTGLRTALLFVHNVHLCRMV